MAYYFLLGVMISSLSALNSFVRVLDERRTSRCTQSGNVAKKTRKYGTPSLSLPPPNAPEWAVRRISEENTGNYHYCCVVM